MNLTQIEAEFDNNWKTNDIGLGKWAGMSTGGTPHYDPNKIKQFYRLKITELLESIRLKSFTKEATKHYNFGEERRGYNQAVLDQQAKINEALK
jgi:hypothetical protein